MVTDEFKKAFEAKREILRICPYCGHEMRLDFESKQFMCDECEIVVFLMPYRKDYKKPQTDMQLRVYNMGEEMPEKVVWIKDTRPPETTSSTILNTSEEEDRSERWRYMC